MGSGALSIAEQTPKPEKSEGGTTQARNQSFCSMYSGTKRKAESQNGEKHLKPGKKLPPVPKFHNDPRIKTGEKDGVHVFLWRCPICAAEKKGPWKNICTMRWYHWKTHHKHVPYEQFLIKPRGAPIPAPSALLPKDQRAFDCPCCDVGLPALETTHMMTKAISKHRRECHPKIKTSKWMSLMCSARFKGKKQPHVSAAATKRHDKARKKRFKTHKPVELDLSDQYDNMPKGESRQWWCSECLQVLAGYGTNYNRKLLTCAQAKKDPRGPRRVKLAWKLVLERDHEHKLQGAVSKWVRSIVSSRKDSSGSKEPQHNKAHATFKKKKLVWDGIEPLPGPSHTRRVNTATANTLIWTINVGGARGAWHVVNHLLDGGPPILLLQEVALPKEEAVGYSAAALKKGYHCYYSGCVQTSRRPHGGSLVLVKKGFKSSPAWNFVSTEGAVQAVWISGTLVCSVYLAPVPGNWQVADETAATLLSLPQEQQWILGGDFNCLPSVNPFHSNLVGVCCEIQSPDGPTRWSSDRCIDYFCSNQRLTQVCTLAHKVSDHKIVSASWQKRLKHTEDFVVQTPPVLPKCSDEQQDSFTKAVDEAWSEESSALPCDGSVDLKWEALNKALYKTLLSAHEKCNNDQGQNLRLRKFAKGKPTKPVVKRRHVAHRPPAGHFTSFQQRAIRNLLGRMMEYRQRHSSEQSSISSRHQTQKLWEKIIRAPDYDQHSSLTENIQKLEKKLEQCVQEENSNRLQRWRARTAEDHHAFRWLRKQATETTHAIAMSKDDTVADSVLMALRKLQSFWKKVWDRPQLDRQAVWNEMVRHLPPAVHSRRWAPVTGQDLKRAALNCKGSAAGLDGWTTEELLHFSDKMWQELAQFYLECENCSRVPEAWRQIRQVHLGKGKPRESNGSMLAANLRPISVTSLIWRVCCKARYGHKDTQAWLKHAMPNYVYGGIPGRGTQDAIGPLLYQTHRYWYVGTLDLEKAFDHADPKLATAVMKHCGLDPRIADMLCHNWTNQCRWLQLLDQTIPESTSVNNSLPQGDSWSMAAMSFLLLPAARNIQASSPGVQQTIFADDRSFACKTATQLATVSRKWGAWMQYLGLRENKVKAQYFHPTIRGRRALVSVGLPPQTISDSIQVLGFTFQGAQASKAGDHEKKRLREAKDRARKCRCLPGSLDRKIRIAQYSAVPKIMWGWICRRPSLSDVQPWEAVCKVLLKTPKTASVHLAKILKGHRWDVRFMATCEVMSVMHRFVRTSGTVLEPWRRAKSGWVGALRRGMRDMGWSETLRPWSWKHVPLNANISLLDGERGWTRNLPQIQHILRESWRHTCFGKWLNQGRIDSGRCRGIVYDPKRLKLLQKKQLSSHEFAVLSGASVSPAKFKVMNPRSVLGCPYCGCPPEQATWDHCTWECRMAPRPPGITAASCGDALLSRLGWPTARRGADSHDSKVLSWLAEVRATTLRIRRP